MSFFSGLGLTGNANFDPIQMNQNAQMLRQQTGQWLQQQNGQLSMQANQNPQAAQLLQKMNEATNNLLNDPILPMIQQIETLVQTAPQPLQKELRDRIIESFEGTGRMRGSTMGMGSTGYGSPMGMGSTGYGSSMGMGSTGYGSSMGMGSTGYGSSMGMGSTGYGSPSYGSRRSSSFFGLGGKIGRKTRKMKGGLRVRKTGGSYKMKGGSCKTR
jgi:hypothetical protein